MYVAEMKTMTLSLGRTQRYLYNKVFFMQPNIDPQINASTVGTALLKSRSFYTQDYWFWICLATLLGFSIIFNILFIVALTFLNRKLTCITRECIVLQPR